jgi:DNA-binding response OmpR family regulator
VAKQNLLLVDADPRSLRLLEVSLRKAGFSIATCGGVEGALDLVELVEPDMIISDTRLPGKDGFALARALRARPNTAGIPLMFLSSDPSVASKVRAFALGIEDYFTKPGSIREILAHVKYVMERSEHAGRTGRARITGSLEEVGPVDLLQTVEMSGKSGELRLSSGKRRGSVFFHEGRVIDAELGVLRGEPAIFRFLLWSEGSFELDFREVHSEDNLGVSTQALLMEGMRRLEEWGRLQERLPSLDCVLEIQHRELAKRLGDIPDELNGVLRAFDGQRDLSEVLDIVGGDDLTTFNEIGKLFSDGLLVVRCRTDATSETQVGTQSAMPSDPFWGYLPQPSSPPETAVEVLGRPPSQGSFSSLSERLTDSARNGEAGPTGEPMRGGSGEPVGIGAGRTALAVVQLKRVLAISEANGSRTRIISESQARPEGALDKESGPEQVRGEGQRADSRSTPAGEGDDDMMKRSKRKAEQAEDRASNVIPLHAARAEAQPAEAQPADTRPADRASDDSGTTSVQRPIRSEGDTEGSEEDGLPPDLSIPPPAPAAAQAAEHELHPDDPDANEFFSSAPPKAIAPSGEPWADFDHDHESAHPQLHRPAMLWTGGIAAAGLVLIGAFLLYHKVFMPTEEPVGRAHIALPTPDMVKVAPSAPEPEPAAEPAPLAAAPVEPAAAEPAPVESAAVEPAPGAAAPQGEPPAAAPVAPAPSSDLAALLVEARKAGYRPRAEELFKQAIASAPGSAEALSGLALVYINQGKNALAKQRAEQALALDAKNDEAWIVLGAAESAVGRNKAARDAYMRCAALPTGKHVAECKRLVR